MVKRLTVVGAVCQPSLPGCLLLPFWQKKSAASVRYCVDNRIRSCDVHFVSRETNFNTFCYQ